jgi:hypothetical protein
VLSKTTNCTQIAPVLKKSINKLHPNCTQFQHKGKVMGKKKSKKDSYSKAERKEYNALYYLDNSERIKKARKERYHQKSKQNE